MHLWRLYLFLVIASHNVYAQPLHYKFNTYTTSNGLPYNSISSIIQDSKGFLWVGTGEGLSRFDGKSFKNYFVKRAEKENFVGNSFSYLHEYLPGNLLFCSNTNLTGFDIAKQKFHSFNYFKNKSIFSVEKTNDHHFLLGGIDTLYFTEPSLKIETILALPFKQKNRRVSGYELETDLWLLGNETEFFLYNSVTTLFRPFIITPNLDRKEQHYYFKFYDKDKKELYFSNFFKGIYRFNKDGTLIQHYKISADETGITNSNIAFINKKNDSIFWVGTLGGGLQILNSKTNRFQKLTKNIFYPSSLPDDNITANFTDINKNEWIGTSKGLVQINFAQRVFREVEAERKSLNAQGFLNIKMDAQGQIFISRFLDKTIYMVNKEQRLQPIKNINAPHNWCLNNFGDQLICSGSGTVISIFEPSTFKYKETDFLRNYYSKSDVVILALKQKNGDEWYCGNNGGGFVRIRGKDRSILQYKQESSNGKFSNSYYSCYAEDKQNDLWFGVNKSSKVLHWSSNNETFEEISLEKAKGIVNETFKGINDIVMDKDENLWIAFDGNGIVCYNYKAKAAQQYTIENGLPTNYISALRFDNLNRLWISTLKGLSCFYPTQKKFYNFSKEDGLPDDYFTESCMLYDDKKDKLWVASNNSLFNFTPDELLGTGQKSFPVYIDKVIINGEQHPETYLQGEKLRASENNIQFYFIAVSLNKGKNIEYCYKLDDADKDWVYNEDITNASYANLRPGKYSFHVRARYRGENIWTTIPMPLSFTIKPNWWQTRGFIIAFSLGVMLLIFLLFRIYFRSKLQKQKTFMEKELAIEQERNRMARDLHDGLGSMLSGIKHSFSAIKNELNTGEKLQDQFDSNINKLDESIIELRNISHSITSEMFLKHGLENSINDYCNALSNQSLLRVNFKGMDLENLEIHQEQAFHIFRIIQELLQNIIKHAAATQALIQLSFHLKKLYLTVEDDGLGYNKELVKSNDGIGLENVKARVKILKGKMDIKSVVTEGTSVFIEIPISNKL